MIELLAYLTHERWAFIRREGRLCHIKPHRQGYVTVLSNEAELGRALTHVGYEHSDKTFEDFDALKEFLSSESVRVWKEGGGALLEDNQLLETLLKALTPADIQRQIDRGIAMLPYKNRPFLGRTLLTTLLRAPTLTPEQRQNIQQLLGNTQTKPG